MVVFLRLSTSRYSTTERTRLGVAMKNSKRNCYGEEMIVIALVIQRLTVSIRDACLILRVAYELALIMMSTRRFFLHLLSSITHYSPWNLTVSRSGVDTQSQWLLPLPSFFWSNLPVGLIHLAIPSFHTTFFVHCFSCLSLLDSVSINTVYVHIV